MAPSSWAIPVKLRPRRVAASPAIVALFSAVALLAVIAAIGLASAGDSRPYRVRTLTAASFEHDTQASSGQTTGRWLILFASADCLASSNADSPCHGILSALKEAASSADSMPGRLFIAAQVDTDAHPRLKKRFGIGAEPALKLFRDRAMFTFPRATLVRTLGNLQSQAARGSNLGDELEDEESDSDEFEREEGWIQGGGDLAAELRRFVQGGYREVGEEKVPGEPSALDAVTDVLLQAFEQYQRFMRFLSHHPVWLASLGGLVAVAFYAFTRWLLNMGVAPRRPRRVVPRARKAE